MAHFLRQIAIRYYDQKVVMVIHQTLSVVPPVKALNSLDEGVGMFNTVLIIAVGSWVV